MANTIKVYIFDADTSAALAGVTVDVKDVATDTSITGAGITDAAGLRTFSAATTAVEYYITASLAGYDSILKAGQYQTGYQGVTYTTAGADAEVKFFLKPTRSRTQVNVFIGTGAGAGTPQTPAIGATVVIKRTDTNATVETLTTDSKGAAFLTDASYTAIGAIYAVVSLAGYNTVARCDIAASGLGDTINVQLTAAVAFTTYTLTGRLIDASGAPIVGRTMQLDMRKGLQSATSGGKEFYVATSVRLSAVSDANGLFVFTIVDKSVVQPVGWYAYLGYPDTKIWVINGANIDVGDGTGVGATSDKV